MPTEPLEPACALPELIARCCRGDDTAWEIFVDRFHRRIARYVAGACRFLAAHGEPRDERARDMVQDVYTRLVADDYRALRAWRGVNEASFVAYLATIVHTMACDELRRQRSKKRAAIVISIDQPMSTDSASTIADCVPSPPETSPDRLLGDRIEEERLLAALAKVCTGANGARNSLIFQLHVIEGLSAREIAALPALDTTTANVESIIRRIKERLRAIM
jgi:RNA polymerase sigma factor (sigma-70 family)